MKLFILDPGNRSKTLSAAAVVNKTGTETVYTITFDDKLLNEKYGKLEIANKSGYWKFPITKTDRYLISLVSNVIFQIMESEIQID